MKKFLSAVLALSLLLSLACPALAEGRLAPLIDSVQSLLFSTNNVTLSGEAVFSLNGERFKTAEILYKQAGEDSHWQLDLKTPRKYRKDQETGYTIIANGEKIWVMEKYYPGTYTTGSDQPSSTLLRPSTRSALLFSMFRSSADLMESLLPENAFSFPETDEPGNVIEIHLAEDTTPALVNASLNLAADFFLRRFMGVNYDSIRNPGQGHPEDYTTVTQAVLYSTDSFALGDTSVTVTEDPKGRISSVSGTVTVLLSSEDYDRTPLEVAFSLSVSDYGATSVKAFDAEDFGVILKGDMPENAKEVDDAIAEKMTARAKEVLAAAGYDAAAFPSSAVVNEAAGIYYVSFLGDSYADTVSVGLNDAGDLLSLADYSNDYASASPQMAESSSLPEGISDMLTGFLNQAFPDLAATAKDYMVGLQYAGDSETWLSVTPLTASGSDTGIFMIVRIAPDLRVVWFNCLDE